MNDRIALLIKAKNISPSQLADELGIQRSGVSHILNNRNKPSLEFIQKLLKKYPDLSMKWIMFGEGPMMNPYPVAELLPHQKAVEEKKSLPAKPLLFELFPDDNQEKEEKAEEIEISGPENSSKNIDNQSGKDEKKAFISDDLFSPEKSEDRKEPEELSETKISDTHPLQKKSEILQESDSGKKSPVIQKNNRTIQKIVIFYSDKTFLEYNPLDET